MTCVLVFSLNPLSYFVIEVKDQVLAKVKDWSVTRLGPCVVTKVQVQPIKNRIWSATEKQNGTQMGKTHSLALN